MSSAHADTFVRDRLPPPDQMPRLLFELPGLQFAARLNCASELLDRWVAQGDGQRLAVLGTAPDGAPIAWSYAELQARANRIARVLADRLGLVPGNRVLLRGANSPMLAACWFGVVKAGGIAVGTMPLLRARELIGIAAKAGITHALVDARLAEEVALAQPQCPTLAHVLQFNGAADGGLESAMAAQPDRFTNVDTAADDCCIIAFTSGTTGQPKAALHYHRDGGLRLLAAACAARAARRPRHRQPAAGIHLRPGRLAVVSPEHRRGQRAGRESLARGAAGGDCAASRDDLLHLADGLPRDRIAARRA
jgi:2-aminobenzoate-CoA ligase